MLEQSLLIRVALGAERGRRGRAATPSARIRAGFGQLSPEQRGRLIEAPHRLIEVPDLLTNQSNIERLRTAISQSDADLQLLGASYALVGDAAVQIAAAAVQRQKNFAGALYRDGEYSVFSGGRFPPVTAPR